MRETLISFETAKLAKEKGFEGFSNKVYNQFGKLFIHNNGLLTNHIRIQAPTQSLLQKWLREQQLFVEVNIEMIVIGQEIFDVAIFSNDVRKENDFGVIRMLAITGNKSYEEALEKGLQEALKLIKI